MSIGEHAVYMYNSVKIKIIVVLNDFECFSRILK